MGLFDRVEARLERVVNGAFAKAFRSEVQPVEIASAVRRAMDDRAAVAGRGRAVVPNVFQIELSPSDYDRLSDEEEDIVEEIVAAAQEHADSQRYEASGRIRVDLVESGDLETGVFRVRPSNARHTGTTGQHARPASASGGPAATASPSGLPAGAPAGPAAAAGPGPGRTPSPADRDAEGLAATAVHQPLPPRPRRVNPADRPWLDVDGDRYPLMGALTVLGRDESADILLDDPGISRRHSEIRVTVDGPHHACSIRDLRSTNGTFVNGERVESARLEDGDRITVGRTSVTFRAGR